MEKEDTRRTLTISLVGLIVSAVALTLWSPDFFDRFFQHPCARGVAKSSSTALDLLEVNHVRTGALVQLPGQTIDVNRICSPLGSPLVLLLCTALFMLRRQTTPARTTFVLAFGCIWAVLRAIATTVTIGFAWQAWEFDLYGGSAFYAVQVASLAAFAALLASTEQLVLFVCGPVLVLPGDMTRLTAWWNRRVAGVGTLPPKSNVEALTRSVRPPIRRQRLWQRLWQRPLKFLLKWTSTRNPRWLLMGMPALLVGCAVMACPAIVSSRSDRLKRQYAAAARDAMARDDMNEAELLYRRLVRETPGDAVPRMRLAELAEEQGDIERARELMRRIAPLPNGGHPEAHLWLAQDLAGRDQPLTAIEAESMRSHLRRVVRLRPSLIDAQEMLARAYLADGRVAAAAEHLKVAAEQRPALRLQLAQVYARQGKMANAQAELRKVIEYCRRRLEAEPDLVDERLLWAQAEVLKGNSMAAANALDDASLPTSDPRRMAVQSAVHVQQSDALRQQEPPQYALALDHLWQALELTPHSPAVLNRLSLLAHEDVAAQATIRQQLEQQVTDGEESAGMYMVLGTIALDLEDYDLAASHFERGRELAPGIIELTSNLAWSLANCDPPQLERALQLSAEVIEFGSPDPKNMVEFRVMRGLVLAEAKRWEEAIAELEDVVRVASDRQRVHLALAMAYDAIGMTDAAAVHRQFSDEQSED